MQTLLLKSMAGFQFHADVRLFFSFSTSNSDWLELLFRKNGAKVFLELDIHFFVSLHLSLSGKFKVTHCYFTDIE